MGEIIVKHYKHKENEHKHKVILEVNTDCDVLAESSYAYLCKVAKEMEKTLDEFNPYTDILNTLKKIVEESDGE